MTTSRTAVRIASGAVSAFTAISSARAKLYRAGLLRQRHLRAKVISVGNITWGGTGKTPFVLWLAARLQTAGLHVSILTRGYRRTSRERIIVLPPGFPPYKALDYGDEVQLFLRHLQIPIGIAASRYEAGRSLEQKYAIDVHLLDDGFQHLQLSRDLDLVLLDSENPWGARGELPRLLRESPQALKRAQAILFTRCDPAGASCNGSLGALKEYVQQIHPGAPSYSVSTRFLGFAEASQLHPTSGSPPGRAVAFCGLGNPGGFFTTLSRASIPIAVKKIFPDHHRYSLSDLHLLKDLVSKSNADCFITTEKDLVNLPQGFSFPRPLYWAAVESYLHEEDKFLSLLGEKLGWSDRFHSQGHLSAPPLSRVSS